jgi:hypothetical protein
VKNTAQSPHRLLSGIFSVVADVHDLLRGRGPAQSVPRLHSSSAFSPNPRRRTAARPTHKEDVFAGLLAALVSKPRSTDPHDWALTQLNLGTALAERTADDKAGNVDEAIACYRAALEVLTRDTESLESAKAQSSLGDAHSESKPPATGRATLKRRSSAIVRHSMFGQRTQRQATGRLFKPVLATLSDFDLLATARAAWRNRLRAMFLRWRSGRGMPRRSTGPGPKCSSATRGVNDWYGTCRITWRILYRATELLSTFQQRT